MNITMTKTNRKRATRKPYKKRAYRKRAGAGQFATVVETLPTQAINLNTPYIISKAGITGVRAPVEAQLFGFYRIAKIIIKHKPLFDTYSTSLPGAGNGPNSVPTLYWKMNRYGDAPPAFNGNYLRSLGSKPIRFDDNEYTISYKPNMLMVGADNAGNNASQIKMTPWISTDEIPQNGNFALSTAEHFGHLLYVEGGGSGTADGAVGTYDVTVIYQFKTPRVPTTAQSKLEAEQLALTSPTHITKL